MASLEDVYRMSNPDASYRTGFAAPWGGGPYECAFQDHPQPMWIVERDTLTVLRANPAACLRFGYSLEQWLLIRFSRKGGDASLQPTPAGLPLGTDNPSIALEGPPAADGTVPGIDLVAHPAGTEDQATMLVTGKDRRIDVRTLLPGKTPPFVELVKVMPAAVCVCDATGAVVLYNRRAVELWGRDPRTEGPVTQFCGSLGMYHPDGTPLPHSDCPMAEAIRTGTSVLNREVVIERMDGSRAHALVSVTPLLDENGARIGAINCFQDITEHWQAEEELRRLASFPELNPTPVVETDLTGRPRYLNPAARQAFPDLESLGCAHPLLRQILDRSTCDEAVDHCMGEITIGAKTYQWRAGRFPVEGRIIVHAADLTAHRRALDALSTSEHRFRALLEQAADAIYVVAADGRFLDVNQRACRSLGYTEDELKTMSVGSIDPNTSVDDVRDIWAQVSQGVSVTIEGTHRRKDGTTFPVEVSVGLIETEARPVMLALARDITVRQRLEAERRQGQRMEAIGQLAGGIAHDFNNLLTVILGSGDLLRQKWPSHVSGREEVEDICKAAVRAATLTQQLLAFSRRQVLKSDVIDLNAVVADMATLLHRVIGETIDIQTTLASNLGAIRADRGQLEQVITNLAVNARDAMPRGGTLGITTVNVTLGPNGTGAPPGAPPGRYVSLTVTDSGMGMNTEVKAHVFEPFFTTKEKYRGTGLGLATVYGIVAQSEGHITVESEIGKGTTFTIFFPCVETTPNEARPHGPRETAPGGSETILVVEDEPAVRELVSRILKARGYSVLVASGGREALDLAQHHGRHIDLLLSDVVMPEMSGRELAERLLQYSPRTRVAFLSGYTDDEILRHGVLDARFAFLQKPFTPDVLARKVREVLDGS